MLHFNQLDLQENEEDILIYNGSPEKLKNLQAYALRKNALHAAVIDADSDLIKELVTYCADTIDINSNTYKNKNTPLHLAAKMGFHHCVKVLLQCGANVNAVNFLNQTPLHLAVAKDNIVTVIQLIEFSPNIDILDNKGNSPLYMAPFKTLFNSNEINTFKSTKTHKTPPSSIPTAQPNITFIDVFGKNEKDQIPNKNKFSL